MSFHTLSVSLNMCLCCFAFVVCVGWMIYEEKGGVKRCGKEKEGDRELDRQ